MLDLNVVFEGMVTLALAVLGLVVLYILYRSHQRMALRKALIDKYASAQNLNELMQTAAGRRLFGEFTSGGSPLTSVLSSVRFGIVGVLSGVGAGAVGTMPGMQAVFGLGVLLLCIGVGFLISAAITYRLSKSWGLLEKQD
jgi:hypothetical protein